MAQRPLSNERLGKSPTVGLRLPPSARERVILASKRHGLTVSEYIRTVLDAAIAEEDARVADPSAA